MFNTIEELIAQSKDYDGVASMMVALEAKRSEKPESFIRETMGRNLDVMLESIEKGRAGVRSVTGLTGGDAVRMSDYLESGESLLGPVAFAAARNAVAVNEVNANMGLICATPTAGSAGVAAGVLAAIAEPLGLDREAQIDFLFVAGAFGLVIANNAGISGAEGGCQAEVGSAAAMAAAALVAARGGDAETSAQAMAMSLANTLGLVCDPVAGLVEVPCVKRNAMGATVAILSADMAMAGVRSVIPPDEVIGAMAQVGEEMPTKFKETAEGGLADTPTGRRLQKQIFGD